MNQFKTILGRIGARFQAGANGGSPSPKFPTGTFLTLSLLGGGSYALYNSMMTVQPGHIGLVYDRLYGLDENRRLKEGLNFVIPWLQRAVIYDVKTRPQLIETSSGSKDLQMVQISLRVLFKPDPNNLTFVYRRLGKDFDARVLPSIVNEVTKSVVAQYNASELLTKRELVSNEIRDSLVRRANDFRIVIDDVAITHLAFSKEYTAAVEAKQVAQQDSERAKYIVDRALQEKKSIVIKAKGEAESAMLIGSAIQKNPAFVELRKIEASKDIASTLTMSGNKVYLDASNLMINTLGETGFGEKKSVNKAANGWFK